MNTLSIRFLNQFKLVDLNFIEETMSVNKLVPRKPEAIIELEKIYNIILFEGTSPDPMNGSLSTNNYTLDELGRVNGISFTDRNITNIEPLKSLHLIELNLTANKIEDISVLSNLTKLKYLFLGGNLIKDITPLKACKNLLSLALWANPIQDMSPLCGLHQLKALYAQRIGFSDLNFIIGLNKLDRLIVSDNKINNLDILTNSTVTSIDLEGNNINTVSLTIAKKFHWLYRLQSFQLKNQGISLENNPLYYPPSSVLELGPETVQNYYESSEKYGHAPLSEGRIIVVGDGSSGKSSLIERLLHNTFLLGKPQTNGIHIDHWKLTHTDKRDLNFHIWDFGGQEIQHAVHKFFFTEGCLYVLVLDNRKEEEPEYWLQQIESLGAGASVLVVFNKQDDNITEIADRKFLREKYPNIVGYYNVSCKTGFGIHDFKLDLEKYAIGLRTVDEQFPENWFHIKKSIEKCTSGSEHYLEYERFHKICNKYSADDEKTQKLLLKYFTTIGAVTWFGDTFLNFLHVLSPAWITQGVYKILTSKKTDGLAGKIQVSDFYELLQPVDQMDYTYDENHYGYILSMMKKFDLCYSPDDNIILIPSAFGKVPKVEYSEFKGEFIRTYILQFKDYMPIALIHKFIAKKLPEAYDNNYWYTGIVIKDSRTSSLAMIQADKESKRIYVRIKGESPLGMWEHIRREIFSTTLDYARVPYEELILLDERTESTVNYEDLLGYLRANKFIYFHPKLQKDFNVGFLIGLFESKDQTIEKFKDNSVASGEIYNISDQSPNIILNILNNNSPTVNSQFINEINIDIQNINNLSSNIKGDANYLINEIKKTNGELFDTLQKIVQFTDDAKLAKNTNDIKEKGWGRKLKNAIEFLSKAGDSLKHIKDGGEALHSMFQGLKQIALQLDLHEVTQLFKSLTHIN